MKFAIAIAFFVLGQCLVADAWYVTCSRFDRHVRHGRSDRSNLHSHVNTLHRYKNDHSRRISTLKSQTSDLTSQLNAQRSDAAALGRSIASANTVHRDLSRSSDSQDSRLRKLETVNAFMFADVVLVSLAETLVK